MTERAPQRRQPSRPSRWLSMLAAPALVLTATAAGCGFADGPAEPASRSAAEASADRELNGAARPHADGAPIVEETAPIVEETGEETGDDNSGLPPRLADRDVLVAPWTRVVSDELAEVAQRSDDRLIVPAEHADALKDLQTFDVLVSGSTVHPFILRVEGTRRDPATGDLIVATSAATLADALLKGGFDSRRAERTWTYGTRDDADFPADAPLADRNTGDERDETKQSSPWRTSRHALRNGGVSYTSLGEFGPSDLGLTRDGDLSLPGGIFTSFGGHLGVNLNGRATATIKPAYWLSLELDFKSGNRQPESPYFFSTRECETADDCFDGEPHSGERCVGYDASRWPDVDTAVASKLEHYDPQSGKTAEYCVYEPPKDDEVAITGPGGETMWVKEYRQCGDLLDTLEWVKTSAGKQCAEDWEVWYESKGQKGTRNPRSCQRDGRDAVAPYPAQLEWAKLVCSGALSHFEFDMRADMKVGIEDFQFEVEGGGSKAWPLVSIPDQTIAGAAFAVGGLPVVVTFNWNLTVPLAINAGTDIGFNAERPRFFGIDEIDLHAGGLHWYASERAYQKGHFGPPTSQRPGDYLDKLHFNQVDPPSGGKLRLPKFNARNFHGTVTLMAKPELNMLLYHAAGPFIEPISPYITLKGAAEEGKKCNLGAKAGAQGKAGLKVQLPFGLGADETSGDQRDGPTTQGEVDSEEGVKKYLSGGYAKSWQLYDTCGSSDDAFQKFEYGPEGRRNIDADPMCEEGINGLCYRKCLWGDCGDNGGGSGSAGGSGGSGSGIGHGSSASGSGGSSGGTSGTSGTGEDSEPIPGGEQGRPGDGDGKGPSGGSFGCSAGGTGDGPMSIWWLGLLLVGGIRLRSRSQ